MQNFMNKEADVISPPIMVAYAEDHTAVRKSIISYIHDLGDIRVFIEASNGRELIDQIDKSRKKPDICMIDIRMPGMNGFETISLLRQKWKRIKTLVLTTFMEEMYLLRMLRAGANGYLSKDCDPEAIKEALMTIHRNENYYPDTFTRKITSAIQANALKIPDFTEKERQFLKYCCSDLTYLQIAQVMRGTPKSIEGYRDSLFRKLQVNSRVRLALFAVQSGIVPLESCAIE